MGSKKSRSVWPPDVASMAPDKLLAAVKAVDGMSALEGVTAAHDAAGEQSAGKNIRLSWPCPEDGCDKEVHISAAMYKQGWRPRCE